jgi:Putative RNA methylase family UPF0020
MHRYLALVPRGLEHAVQEILQHQLHQSSAPSCSCQVQVLDDLTVFGSTQNSSAAAAAAAFMGAVQSKVQDAIHVRDKQRKKQGNQHRHQTVGGLIGEDVSGTVVGAATTATKSPVGTVQIKDDNDDWNSANSSGRSRQCRYTHVSVGYTASDNVPVWCIPGQVEGTVWMEIRVAVSGADRCCDTAITIHLMQQIARIRCLGPILALVDFFEFNGSNDNNHGPAGLCRLDAMSKEEASIWITDKLQEESYRTNFARALELWVQHANAVWSEQVGEPPKQYCWTDIEQGKACIKYRLSCMRSESKRYQYPRQELLASCVADHIIPPPILTPNWTVDLTNYDVEVVLLQRSGSFAVGITLRPYQFLNTRAFTDNAIPADTTPPFVRGDGSNSNTTPSSSPFVRLRPTTAQILLHLARIQVSDVVLDPCAGIGTIPIEAAIQSPAGLSLGGDVAMMEREVRDVAVEYSCQARKKIRAGSKTEKCSPGGGAAEMLAWDATNLPVRPQSIDVVISDLPFGRKCMSTSELDKFLPLFLSEAARVLRPSVGRMVLLCGSCTPILEALKSANNESHNPVVWNLPADAVFPVNIGGTVAFVVQVSRGSADSFRPSGYYDTVKKLANKKARIRKFPQTTKIKFSQS